MAGDEHASLAAEIAAYNAEREALIAQERALRHDDAFRQAMSPTARRAAAIVQKIRAHEAETVWKKAGEDAGDAFPGMSFTLAKDRMEKTMLWKIVRRFPKGALLHAHLEAMAAATDGMYMHSPIPLTSAKALETAAVEFFYAASPPPTAAAAHAGIYSSSYVASTPVLLSDAISTFPASLLTPPAPPAAPQPAAAEAGFREWFVSRTTITPEESLLHHAGVDAVWAKFQSVFRFINGIVYYEPIFRAFVGEVLGGLLADNCTWVDLRLAMLMNFRAAGTGEVLARHHVVRVLAEEVARFTAASGGRFVGASLIWTTVRHFGAAETRATMRECIDAKQRYPDVLAGFDLVGQEDLGRTLHEHLPELLWFRRQCAAAGVDVPFFFHAGETLGDGSPTDLNVVDAVLLGTRRMGHAFSLYKHPRLVQLCRERGVCLEVCPISNEVLRLTATVLGHPLPALLAHGVPVCLNNDDPGILGQARSGSLSHDYWQVLNAFHNVGLPGLGALAETGVRYAAYAGAAVGDRACPVAAERVRAWHAEWERFCAWLVAEFAEWAGEEEEDAADAEVPQVNGAAVGAE